MKVEKDEFLIDGGQSAMMTMRIDGLWQTVADLSCGNRKGTATNSRQLDGRPDVRLFVYYVCESVHHLHVV